jgi:C-methyltransferase C-terminal domain/Putative zinc binding domain/Methyltransferase domain
VTAHTCRGCGAPLRHTFVDLRVQPLANSYLEPESLDEMEPFYPLHVRVCERCFLVQLPAVQSPEHIFGDYAYFSSFSDLWLRHAKEYVDLMVERLGLGPQSHVLEIASNDGYLLQYVVERGIPALGVEPAANVAQVAEKRGIPTLVAFFGVETARRLASEGRGGDLIAANNVLAHVPDLHDFVGGLVVALNDGGTITVEFPHVLRLIEGRQFDTIYHEHFSYLSLVALEPVFARHGLAVVDVDRLATHGGSLRLYLRHANEAADEAPAVADLRADESAAALDRLETYTGFGDAVAEIKRDLLTFLVEAKRAGERVVGYGAPAKGNTLLNYCGVGAELLEYTVDRSPHKQGRFLPGTRIPIHGPERLIEDRPDHVLVLPWNIADEIVEQLAAVHEWGGRFVVAIPRVAEVP